MTDVEARLRAELPEIAANITVTTTGSVRGRRSPRLAVAAVSGLLVVVLAVALAWARLNPTKPGRLLTVQAVVHATSAAHTARLSFDKTGAAHGTGYADLADGRYLFHEQITDPLFKNKAGFKLTVVLLGNHTVFAKGLTPTWCELNDPAVSREPFGLDPAAVLGSLRLPVTLQRLGTATIRGVATTHYRILDSPTWSDLWVDGANQLRRISYHANNTQPSRTIDFFDYGAQLPPITAPATYTQCISP